MAHIDRPAEYPNLLHIYGTDVVAIRPDGARFDLRPNRVKEALFADSTGIGNFRGHVDFIQCYVVDAGGPPSHCCEDHTPAVESPPLRPLRGVIKQVRNLREPFTDQQLANHMQGIGHEMGHYWLIPGKARIIIGSSEIETPTSDEIASSLNNGLGIPPVPIIGRQDGHWSPYIHADGSFMDGIDHLFDPANVFLESIYGFSKSRGVQTSGIPFDFEGTELTPTAKFSEFELFLMGMPPLTGIPRERMLQIIEPDWVYPLPFHAGLYVELANGETWYHGFFKGPDQICALPIDDLNARPITSLTQPFDPYNRVVFRVVQIGNESELQARVFEPQRLGPQGCLYAILTTLGAKFVWKPKEPRDINCNDVLEEARFAANENPNVYEGWRRMARFSSKVTRVGLGARHIGSPCFARIKPKILCLSDAGTQVDFESSLAIENEINFADPSWGSTVLNDGSLVLPYRIGPNTGATLKHDDQANDAPRRVMDTPTGDFVFGGEIELSQCILVSWAGGAGRNRTYIGRRREVPYSDVNYLAHWGPQYQSIRQAEPDGGAYRFLFCLVSEGELNIADRDAQLFELDRARRAWESAFAAMTSGRRGAETEIPFP